MHSYSYIHRNIKSENVQIDLRKRKVKVSGFEFSTKLKQNQKGKRKTVGDLLWQAPEMACKK